MSRRKARKPTKQPALVNKKRKLVVAVGLLVCLLATTGILAQRARLWHALRPTASLPPNAAPSPTGLEASSPAKEYVYAGSRLIATEEPTGGSSCTFTLSSTSATFTSSGGSGNVDVTTAAGCSWTAVSDPNNPWITINSGSSGSGNGTVNYSVAANSTSSNRSGTMTIAGQTFTVTQSGSSCTYSIFPTSKSFTASGGSDTVTVTADAGCQWTAASSNPTWLHITPPTSGTGNGSVNYLVDPNSGSQTRSGNITIADRVFSVTQSGTTGGCALSLTPTSASVPGGGGSGSISISTATGCSWTASSPSPFISLTPPTSGSGNGSIAYSVTANPGTKSRIGTIIIATSTDSKNFLVNQGVGGGGGGGGTGTGLTGEYFNYSSTGADQRLCGTLVFSRLDQTVNFDWGAGSPGAGVGADFFHVRWTGQVEAPESGSYTFSVRTDDGVKLWVNNQLLIDKWYNQYGDTWSNIIALTAGQKYDIRMEMYEWNNSAEAHLWWRRPSMPVNSQEIIPTSRLYPYNPAAQPIYEGWLDAVDCTTLTGWAFNRRQLNTAINVSIYADSNPTPLATVTANQYRADLVNYTCDNAQHGFSWTVPQSLKDGQPHSITVTYAGTSIALSGTPANLTCSAGFTVPAAPSNLTATVVSPSQINLVWQDNSNNENGFVVQRGVDGASYSDYATINSPNVTTYSDVGLAAGHTYCYKVLAFNSNGRSTASNSACATIQGGSQVPPNPPSGLTGTYFATPARHVDLSWTDNSNNEDNFQVLRRNRQTSSTKWSSYISLAVLPANTTSYSDASYLASNYTYGYVVRAWNAVSGFSGYSNEVQISVPSGSSPTCASVNAFSGTGGSGSYGYVEGAGGVAKWRTPSAGATGIDPVSGLNALFVADTENHSVRMIYLEGPATGSSILLAGSGVAGYSDGNGDPYQARFNYPQGITAIKNQSGVVAALLVADTDNKVIRELLPPLGKNRWRVSLFSGQSGKTGYVDSDAANTKFNSPRGIAVGLDGFIYVADTYNKAVRFLNFEGHSATWYKEEAQSTFQPVGITFNQITGEIYISDQGNHRIDSLTEGTLVTLAGSGSAGYADGTGTAAVFNTPYHIAWYESESGGAIYIADLNNSRLRVFDSKTNAVTTWAGSGTFGYVNSTCSSSQFNLPSGAAMGPANELYVIERGNNSIRKVQ